VLVFCQDMRTEAIASGNRLSYVQSDAIEQGAEKWVLAQCESYPGDAITVTEVPAEALQVGNGYFWILGRNQTTDQQYWFAIMDEAGKLNLNSVTANQLINLPGMDEDSSQSITNWASANGTGSGSDSSDYNQLPEPYDAKHSKFESVEELLLIDNQNHSMVNSAMLFGLDQNRDGVVSQAERNSPPANNNGNASVTQDPIYDLNRGIFDYLTCYSVEPNTASDGSARINVNSTNTQPLQQYLTKTLGASVSQEIMQRLEAVIRRSRGRPAFSSIGMFYQLAGMTPQQFSQVADKLTTSSAKTLTGMVNVNTAPAEVLMSLPGMQQSDATGLVAARSQNANPGIGWIFQAIAPQTAANLTRYISARSYIYSADIVAVSGDGRSFKRVRIVVDARQTPAKIIYRHDLTTLGWPLPQEIRDAMQKGQQPPIYNLTGAPSTLGQ
jgi:DNA uptake protein ComE-like DNA-binding protein